MLGRIVSFGRITSVVINRSLRIGRRGGVMSHDMLPQECGLLRFCVAAVPRRDYFVETSLLGGCCCSASLGVMSS